MKVTLEMTEQQARTLLHALDFYSRVGCGQFNMVSEVTAVHWPKRWDEHGMAANGLQLAKRALFPEFTSPATSYSIPNRAVPVTFRRAWDMYEHVRQAMAVATDPNPAFRDVRYDGAMNVSDEPLPIVTVTK